MPALGARVSERLAALPGDDPVSALARLSGLLSDVRSWSRTPGDETLAAVAAIDAELRAAYRHITRYQVTGDPAPWPHPRADVRTVVEECLLRMAQTYLWLSLPWTDPAAGRAAGHHRAGTVMARGLRACTAVLKWTYLWHANLPSGLWADSCRLLSCAEALGISRAPLGIDPTGEWRTSVEREFLKACMLATSGPERMSPAQVDAVERTLEFCADALVLSPRQDRRLRFVIDLDDGAPPRPASGLFGETSRSLGMDCYDVRLDDLIKRVATGRLRASAFGPVLDQALVLHTLSQARARWTAHHH
jgi:hypothetical protein